MPSNKINKAFYLDFAAFFVTLFFSVALVSGFIGFLPYLFSKIQYLNTIVNSIKTWYILLALPFIGATLITKMYSKNRKSIKAFNDLLLLVIAVGGIYAAIFFGIEDLTKNEYLLNIKSLSAFSIKILFLMCSLAKVIITFVEFSEERKKEIEAAFDTALTKEIKETSESINSQKGVLYTCLLFLFFSILKKRK